MKTNSGEDIVSRWDTNSDLHGATPIEAGVVAVVDMLKVRARLPRRALAREAIVKSELSINCGF